MADTIDSDDNWIQDRREEFKQMHGGFRTVMATEKQIDLIKQLCKDAWLFKDEFPSSRKFYRKKTLTSKEADHLIKVAPAKKSEPAHLQEREDRVQAALLKTFR